MNSSIIKDLIDKLVKHGSVSSLAVEVGDDAAAMAMHELTMRAPQEIQSSWPLVIQWGRFQAAYDIAERIGDASGMLKAAEAQRKMIMDLY